MRLSDLATSVAHRWKVAAIVLVACVVIAAVFLVVSPRRYGAQVVLYISAQAQPENAQAAYQGSLLSEQRVKSYTELAGSNRVAADVIARLGLTMTPEQLSKEVSATSASETVLMTVAVSDPDPVRAAQIANTLGDVLTSLVADLERPIAAQGAPAVALRVVEPASIDDRPVSPNVVLVLVLGVLVGAFLGAATALVLDVRDKSVRNSDQLREALDVPLLGSISQSSSLAESAYGAWSTSGIQSAEEFRNIRSSLQFIVLDRSSTALVVTSCVPGEGKTTVVSNVASALGAAAHSVVLVDGDLRKPRGAEYLGVDGSVGLSSILSNRCSARDAVQRIQNLRFDFIASGPRPPNPSELLGSQAMDRLIDELRARYQYVLIDAPPVLPVTDSAVLGSLCDGLLVVASEGTTRTNDLVEARRRIEAANGRLVGTILNFSSRSSRPGSYSYYGRPGLDVDSVEGDASSTDVLQHNGDPGRGPVPSPVSRTGGRRT